ncbi:hypothetical protein, partial [Burkholderia pseudomallei]|uniref:hypothetical protein n=1 Tax=Burkholderia pseudomallei TaxID=28450 RepID=UPI0021BB9538
EVSSAASDVYKRQKQWLAGMPQKPEKRSALGNMPRSKYLIPHAEIRPKGHFLTMIYKILSESS